VVALTCEEFERAGREFGEISEEGGLAEWEGEVSLFLVPECYSMVKTDVRV
jgi:hypothetical protein